MPRMKTKLFTIKYYQALFLNLGFCHLICKSVWPQKRLETLSLSQLTSTSQISIDYWLPSDTGSWKTRPYPCLIQQINLISGNNLVPETFIELLTTLEADTSTGLTLIDFGFKCAGKIIHQKTCLWKQNADYLQDGDEILVFINLITRLHLENVQVTQLVGLVAVLH